MQKCKDASMQKYKQDEENRLFNDVFRLLTCWRELLFALFNMTLESNFTFMYFGCLLLKSVVLIFDCDLKLCR